MEQEEHTQGGIVSKTAKDGARVRRVGRENYRVSAQHQVALPREIGLEGSMVEELLVEEAGMARLRKGDVILRRK